MKKFYDSRDLQAMITYSNSSSSIEIWYNVFIPWGFFTNDDIKNQIRHIKSEIKKISNEDMENSKLNLLAPSLLTSQLLFNKFLTIQNPEEFIIRFIEFDFTNFSNYFSFFLDYGFLSIVSPVKPDDIKKFKALSFISFKDLLDLAYKYYTIDKETIISFQEEYKKIIHFIFNLDNDKDLNNLSPHNLLFLYELLDVKDKSIFRHRDNINITENIDYLYEEFSINTDYKRRDTKSIIKKVKELSNNNEIKLEYGKIYRLSSIFEIAYLMLKFLINKDNTYIKQCKCCNKYFYTNKANVTYCDRIQNEKTKQTCKDIGADIVALREKKKDYLVNLKASIASKKAMEVKRHPDIPEYKANYNSWKPLALKYLQQYKNGTLDANTFEEWLRYTSSEKIKSQLKKIDDFK